MTKISGTSTNENENAHDILKRSVHLAHISDFELRQVAMIYRTSDKTQGLQKRVKG